MGEQIKTSLGRTMTFGHHVPRSLEAFLRLPSVSKEWGWGYHWDFPQWTIRKPPNSEAERFQYLA